MSDINSSLIGFLKKKSLFSPDKQLRKNKSKDKRDLVNTPITKNNLAKSSSFQYHSQSSKNLNRSSQRQFQTYERESDFQNNSMFQESPIRYEVDVKPDRPKRNFNFKSSRNPEEKQIKKPTTQQQPTVWTGLVNYATSFQSARIQSATCLQGLSTKLHAQISSINYKVDMFNSKMTQILNKQFKNLEEKIYKIIGNVFAESEKNIRNYIKHQEQILAGQLLIMKESLTKQLYKVESMKEEIGKPNWRKVAGELLSSELETKIEDMLKKSRSIDIEQWEVGDLGAKKIMALQQQLKQIIMLNPH